MLSALAFNIIPTIFEVGLVTGVLVSAGYLVFLLLLRCLLSVRHSAVFHAYIALVPLLAESWRIWLNMYDLLL